MSVVIYSTSTGEYDDWVYLTMGATVRSNVNQEFDWPYPLQGSVLALYKNKCKDTITGIWTPWYTNYMDVGGSQYPGDGFDSGTYRIAGIIYGREQ